MSFTYDPSDASSRNRVRLLIGDTSAALYVFEDEELDIYLGLPTVLQDVLLAAAWALRTLAVNQAKQAIYYSINGLTMDRRRVSPTLLDIADRLEKSAGLVPYEYESVLDHLVTDDGVDLSSYADGFLR